MTSFCVPFQAYGCERLPAKDTHTSFPWIWVGSKFVSEAKRCSAIRFCGLRKNLIALVGDATCGFQIIPRRELIFACFSSWGTWCSGITPAQHAGGPGLNPQCVHFGQVRASNNLHYQVRADKALTAQCPARPFAAGCRCKSR